VKMFRIELENEFEADIFSNILEEEGIPYTIVGNESLVYDGLFTMTLGWGHVEIPYEYKEKAINLYDGYREAVEKSTD